IHIYFLIEFDTKIVVVIQWAWNYITRNRRSRLITGKEAFLESQPINNNSPYQATENKQPVKL
ncbi:MAG: NAD(P)/FAD-dependent oxidoreductase, partial [Dolichospermum sp.]